MRISKPELFETNEAVAVRAKVECGFGEEWLWYSVPHTAADWLAADTSDSFLTAMTPVAMALGEDIRVDGPVSSRLLFNIRNGYTYVLRSTLTGHREPQVTAQATDDFEARGTTVGTAMSGGVDSTHAIFEYFLANDVPSDWRIGHLLFFNAGANGDGQMQEASVLFRRRVEKLQDAADDLGLPLLAVDSNVSHFYDQVGLIHNRTATPRNVSVAMALQARMSRFLVASGPPWSLCSLEPTRFVERTDPFGLPLLRTERFEARSVGGDKTRGEKVRLIADHDFTRTYLNPCVRGLANCGACKKCLGVLIALEALDRLDEYEHLFDLEAYSRKRSAHVEWLLHGDPGMSQSFVDLAASQGRPLKSSLRNYSKFLAQGMESRLPSSVGNARRKLSRMVRRKGA